MKTKIHFRKLDMRGFSHEIGMAVFAVIFAVVGVGYLVASHAESNCKVTEAVGSKPVCTPVSGPVSAPVSSPVVISGEQLSVPPERRPVQYNHRCSTQGVAEYDTQGTPNCLPGGTFLGNYGNVAGTVYSYPCATAAGSNSTAGARFVYVSSAWVCPGGTTRVTAAPGEQLSRPPARRPVQYLHRCSTSKVAEYDTQGTPNCLPGGAFLGNYAPTVPGTYYSTPCRTNTGTPYRYAYIVAGGVCPTGTVAVSKT